MSAVRETSSTSFLATEHSKDAGKDVNAIDSIKSRVPEIWNHFLDQMDRIDALEKRINEHATRARRRIASVLDQTPTHRRSHLRMFVTHRYDEVLSRWTLVIEGKLLVGHLDHKRAAEVEQEVEISRAKAAGIAPKESALKSVLISPVAADNTPKSEAETPGRSDRHRTVGEKEEDPVDPIFFTHLFDKLEVVFRTIYQPKKPPSTASFTAAKKSRATKRKAEKLDPSMVNPKQLRASEPTKLNWTKEDAPDAHAFFVNYTNDESKRPTPPDMKFHSVVATITMNCTRSETMYQPSPALAEKFFPKHKNDNGSRSSRSGESSQKRRKTEGPVEETSIPLENEIAAPSLLTMDEIIMAIFQYIHDKKLQDKEDKSIIMCDKVLSSLLDCESMNFADLHQTLLSKDLVVPVKEDESPIVLTYVMTEKTTSPQSPTDASQEDDDDDDHQNQVLSFDMDVSIPSFFHYRSRELLRRVKKREFEYTSSRTKARYLLVASRGNEDVVKNKIEQVVSGRGYAAENIPVFLALAKAAPPESEARGAAQIDARICAVMERLEECSRRVGTAWELVEALKNVAK